MPTSDSHASEKVLRGTYQLLAKLGSGGMGEVYIAAHTRMSKRFAVKLLAARHGASDEAYARFQREAEITSRLGHPHIVEIIDFDTADDGRPFMVMELLEGEDLADRLRRGAMPVADAMRVAQQLASALQAAHDAGIVHRDLKPQNVFITQREGVGDFVKILDFGISKIKDHGSVVTQSQVVIGTPGYMSPEQAEGRVRSVDARSDQFALAVIVYEMMSGVAPFAAESIPSTLYRVVHHRPRELRELVDDVPACVSAAVARAMEKDAAERFADIATFMAALRGEVAVDAAVAAGDGDGDGVRGTGNGVRTTGGGGRVAVGGKRVVGVGDGEAETLMHAQTEVSTAGMTQQRGARSRAWFVAAAGVLAVAVFALAFVALRYPQPQPQPQPQPPTADRTAPTGDRTTPTGEHAAATGESRENATGAPSSATQAPSSGTRAPSSEARTPSSETRAPSSATRSPSPGTRSPTPPSGTRSPTPSSGAVPVDAGAPAPAPTRARQDAGGESDFITDF